ncbi:uncharacterized protein LOC108850745 [Raphanus sativus]|uniref:Uncharacterized protein LOC108850745 n=1 Tax=Raphanus sativus TaxID=3726 RepID=A0A6J0N5G9_RAPSA|nr:uncharacterized protein LOC108850745 [Raphanus sativus]
MQPPRRSSRLNRSVSSPSNDEPIWVNDPTPGESSRRSRKRVRRRSPAPPEPTEVAADSVSDDDSGGDNHTDVPIEETLLPKEPRYEESRAVFQAMYEANPEYLRPSKHPLSARFATMAARGRYCILRDKNFVPQQRLVLTNKKLAEVRETVFHSGFIYTVVDSDAFQPTVIREFVANLPDAEERDGGVAMYLRESVVTLSPGLINSLYCIPGSEDDPNWRDENIDKVCSFLSGGRVNR